MADPGRATDLDQTLTGPLAARAPCRPADPPPHQTRRERGQGRPPGLPGEEASSLADASRTRTRGSSPHIDRCMGDGGDARKEVCCGIARSIGARADRGAKRHSHRFAALRRLCLRR